MLWAAAVCLTVAGYEDVGQASGSGDFCKGGYGTAVAAAASAQNKPASSVTGPGVGECRHMPNEEKEKKNCPSRLPPCVTNHPLLVFLCLIAAPVGNTLCIRQSNAACISFQPCLPFCVLPVLFQNNSSSYNLILYSSHAVLLSVLVLFLTGRSEVPSLP